MPGQFGKGDNPEETLMMRKEQLYKTAQIKPTSPWPFMEFSPDEFVAVRYVGDYWDGFTESTQPVYEVRRDDRHAYMYALSLYRFCL